MNLHIAIPIKKISVDNILFFIEFILVIQPAYFLYIGSTIINSLLLVATILELLIFLKAKIRKPSVEAFILFFTMYGWIITVFHHSLSIVASLRYPYAVILTILMISRRLKKNLNATIHDLACFFWIIIFINFCTVLLFPTGMFHNLSVSSQEHTSFFFGVDNQFGKIFFPGLSLIWFDEKLRGKNNSMSMIISLLMVGFCYFSRINGTGVIVYIVYLALYLTYSFSKDNIFLSWKLHSATIALLFLVLIFSVGINVSDSEIARRITAAVGKNTTFSGRTLIWAECVKSILRHPIFGKGQYARDVAINLMGLPYSAHNKVLQIIVESGLSGLVLLLLLIRQVYRKSEMVIDNYPEIKTLHVGMFSTFLYFMTETATFIPLYMIFIVISAFVNQMDTRALQHAESLRKI